MGTPLTEVRRFLHCNYNCRDGGLLERFYTELFGLRAVMRTADEGGDGAPFGLFGRTWSETVFLYDHRGGRRSSALELVAWTEPPAYGSPYPVPWFAGIHSAGYTADDLDDIAGRAGELGGEIVRRGDGWLLLRDPEGVAVEVVQSDGPSEGRYLRVVCSDLDRARAWWARLGLVEGMPAGAPGAEIWPGDGERRIVAEVGLHGTDDPTFGILLTEWCGPQPPGPAYGVPFHHGLFRIALAVDDVRATYDALRAAGITRQTPTTFQLPGTKLTAGLTILFIRDPDDILIELVERPRVK